MMTRHLFLQLVEEWCLLAQGEHRIDSPLISAIYSTR